jgi:hypothetical protein
MFLLFLRRIRNLKKTRSYNLKKVNFGIQSLKLHRWKILQFHCQSTIIDVELFFSTDLVFYVSESGEFYLYFSLNLLGTVLILPLKKSIFFTQKKSSNPQMSITFDPKFLESSIITF